MSANGRHRDVTLSAEATVERGGNLCEIVSIIVETDEGPEDLAAVRSEGQIRHVSAEVSPEWDLVVELILDPDNGGTADPGTGVSETSRVLATGLKIGPLQQGETETFHFVANVELLSDRWNFENSRQVRLGHSRCMRHHQVTSRGKGINLSCKTK